MWMKYVIVASLCGVIGFVVLSGDTKSDTELIMDKFLKDVNAEPIPQEKCVTDVSVQKIKEYDTKWYSDKDYLWNYDVGVRIRRCSSVGLWNYKAVSVPAKLFNT